VSAPGTTTDARLAELERENAKLRKIRDVLVRRVERSMDLQGSEFALFERATLLEAEVRRRTELLEQALAELRHSNRALGEAKALAEAANLSKTRFLAAASHDLLQPLNAARLFLSALAETDLPGRAVRLVENVEIAFESVERLLTALLDIAKLDTGGVTPAVEDVPLGPLLRRLVAEFTPVAERRSLALRLVPTSAVVRTDRDMLARALMNLVSNALRYTHRGGVLIGARRDGHGFRVEVVDTGIGIAADQQALIFEEFRRLGTDADERDRGFGLGLAIVDRIARILDHPLRVRSVPGRGSCFSLHLPAAARQEAAAATGGTGPAPSSHRRGALLVVIENEAAIREGMRVLLEGWGYGVLTAASAEAAMTGLLADGRPPDALIADYHLDGGTGAEAIATLRTRLGAAVPAAVITADRSPEVQRTLAALEIPLVNKPVRPAQLRALLAHLLEPNATAASPRSPAPRAPPGCD
jgi:signal transduction histidine kinase/CheY-like chemotaxis protein